MEETKNAVIYCRVSTEEQQDGTSIEDQEQKGRQLAERNGYEVVEVCSDPGISGTKYESRPGLMNALKMLETKKANVLTVSKIDRLGRSMSVIFNIVQRVRNAGASLVTPEFTFDDTIMGKILLTFLSLMAEIELDNIHNRTHGGMKHRARSGVQPSRTNVPYGYRVPKHKDVLEGTFDKTDLGKYIVYEPEAGIIRRVFNMKREGHSFRSIARALNADNVPTQTGVALWHPTTIRGILTNPVYKGEATFGRWKRTTEDVKTEDGYKQKYHYFDCLKDEYKHMGEVITIPATAIVTPELWEYVNSRISEGKQMYSGNPKRRYALSGLLRCPECGGAMAGQGKKVRTEHGDVERAYYRCAREQSRLREATPCHKKHYAIRKTDEAIARAILDVAANPAKIAAAIQAYTQGISVKYTPRDLEDLDGRIAALQTKIKATVAAQIEGVEAGADTSIYTDRIGHLSAQKRAFEDKRREIADYLDPKGRPTPEDEAAIVSNLLATTEQVLTSPFATGAERHNALVNIIDTIVPTENGGFRIALKHGQAIDTVHEVKSRPSSTRLQNLRRLTIRPIV